MKRRGSDGSGVRRSLERAGDLGTEAAVTAFEARSERMPVWLWALSWTFWLAITAAVVGLGVHKIKVHEEQLLIDAETWRTRFEICKRLSDAPRPSWRECLARMEEAGPNFLAPATPGS